MNPTATDSAINPTAALAGKYLTVVLEDEACGFDVLKIREIIRLQKITPVPQMPACVKGVVNLRGREIPIVDLRAGFRPKVEIDRVIEGANFARYPARHGPRRPAGIDLKFSPVRPLLEIEQHCNHVGPRRGRPMRASIRRFGRTASGQGLHRPGDPRFVNPDHPVHLRRPSPL